MSHSDLDHHQEHSHCESCIQPSMCKYIPDQSEHCILVPCPQNCTAVFMHECKLEEHIQEICPNTLLPCINASYGCPATLRRSERGKHLIRCPASIVVCSAVWNRESICKETRANLKNRSKLLQHPLRGASDTHTLPLDIACALKDQMEVIKSFQIPKRIRRVFCDDFYFRNHPLLPVPVLEEIVIRKSVPTNKGTSVSLEDDSSSSAPWNKDRNPRGLSDSFLSDLPPSGRFQSSDSEDEEKECNLEERSPSPFEDALVNPSLIIHCGLCKTEKSENFCSEFLRYPDDVPVNVSVTEHEGDRKVQSTTEADIPPIYSSHSLLLNVVPEFLSIHQQKPGSMFSFACSELLHRTQFASHYRNVHCDIVPGLNGWFFSRCPLFNYGCDHYEILRSPKLGNQPGKISFCDSLSGFALCPDSISDRTFPISNIPFDILCKITHFLDGFSLNSLSATCKAMREVVEEQLKHQGLVNAEWTKSKLSTGGHVWKYGRKKWFFSKTFPEIIHWEMRQSKMNEHLRQCSCYDPIKHDKPFKLVDELTRPNLTTTRLTQNESIPSFDT